MQHHKKVPQARLSQGLQPQKPPPQKNAPLSAAVESDVVGYTTIETIPGFNMLGIVFQSLGGNDKASINELLDGDFQTGDEVQVFDKESGTYVILNFSDGEWKSGPFSADTLPVSVGDAFWIKTQGNVPVTIKGKIRQGDYLYTSVEGFQMVSPSFPITFCVNDVNVKWSGMSDGDEIQVLNEQGTYDIVTYSTTDGKWKSGPFEATTTIKAGQSLWLKTLQKGARLRIESPL